MDPTRWQRVQEIFFEASELEPSARAAYLDTACTGDEGLRGEVEGFLQSLESHADDPLARAIGAEAARVMSLGQESVEGTMFGPYRLLGKIGQGGMGAVYRAERADRQFDRQVAIKFAPPDVAGSAARLLRFQMERQILANLNHPNIASLLDGGVSESGNPYLVMEFVEGRPIDEYCRVNSLTVRQRIELLITVCAAVHYAHRNLVIHRDIKPSNILVTPNGVPKLLDFGIAKLTAPGVAGLTLPAERLMTLEYAAPEQLMGLAVTTAADVYGLGAVLWELLTGSRLFECAGPGSEAPAPSQAARQTAAAETIGRDLDDITLMALRKDPSARYSSVDQLEDDLRCYLAGFPVHASRGRGLYRAVKFVRRHRAAVAASGLFVLTLGGFGAGMSTLAARAARERDKARDEQARAEQISKFLSALFASSDPFQSKGHVPTAKDLLDDGARRIARDLSGQPQTRAALLDTMAAAYQHLGLQQEAEDLFRQEAQAEEEASGPDRIGVARALRQLGDVERERTRLADADRDLRRALDILRHASANGMELAHTLNDLGLVVQARGQLDEAQSLFRQAVKISELHPDQITETLVMKSNLGGVLADIGNFDDAETELRGVLDRRRQLLGENHPQVLRSMLRLGSLMNRRGKFEQAESLYVAALAGDRKILGEKHPDTLAVTNNLAAVLQEKGELAEAERLYRSAIQTGTDVLGDHADVAVWRANLAGLLTTELRYTEAEALLRASLALCREKLGPGSPREAHMLERHAAVEQRLGRYEDAERSLTAALAIQRGKLGDQHSDVAALIFDLAELRRSEGRITEAEPLYRQALEIDRRAFPGGHLQTAAHQLGYAELVAQMGRSSDAEALAREALRFRRRALSESAWQIADAESVLGGVETRQARYPEAEQLLLASFERLKARPGLHTTPTQEALQRVLELYRAWQKPAEEAGYRKLAVKW